jgi:DinB family protein
MRMIVVQVDRKSRVARGGASVESVADRGHAFHDGRAVRDWNILAFVGGRMNETPQQYTQRILGYIDGKEPLAVQAATAKKLDRLIKGVSTARLRKRPAPDKWSVSEVIAHLVDAEIVGAFRIRLILGSPGTSIVAYDQDSWVTSGHYEKRDPRKSVEQFRVLREANLALLASLEPAQWKHYGVHSERGRESIEHIVRMFAGHDMNHLQQMEKILARPS